MADSCGAPVDGAEALMPRTLFGSVCAQRD
jgi:hypothetical protein